MDDLPATGLTPVIQNPGSESLQMPAYDLNHLDETKLTSMSAFTCTRADPDTVRPIKKRRRSHDSIASVDHNAGISRSSISEDVCLRDASKSPAAKPSLHASTSSSTTSEGLNSGKKAPGYASTLSGSSSVSIPVQGPSSASGLLAAETELIAQTRPEMARLFQEIEEHEAHEQPALYNSYCRLQKALDDHDVFAHFETDPLPVSDDQAYPTGEFKSLLISKEDLQSATSDGGSIHQRYAVIKIPGTAKDAPDLRSDFDAFRRRVGYALSKSMFQYQNYEGHDIQQMRGSDFFRVLNDKMPASAHPSIPPKNFLSLSGFTLHDSSEPPALRQLGYDLLTDLLMRIRSKLQEIDGSSDPAGKENLKVYYLSDLEACLSFLLYGQRGSLSLWHMDILNGTWVRCISGMKLWFVYTGAFDEEAKQAFAQKGIYWLPPKGTVKCYILRPGDTLIMRPGYPIVHAVITLEDSLMTGGMMWPRSGIASVMRNLQYIMTHPNSTNEQVARQLPAFLNELQLLMRENLSPRDYTFTDGDMEAVDGLRQALYPTFSCAGKCKGGCKASCPCKKQRSDKVAGCSVWCHSNFALNPNDGCTRPTTCKCFGTCKGCVCSKLLKPCSQACHKCSCGKKAKGLECVPECTKHDAHEKCQNMKKELEEGETDMKIRS